MEDYSKIKILTIDDEVCIRQSIRTFLEDYGFVVLEAEKRWQGLENQLRKSQKMEAIATPAGGIAHDLNNILSPILGYADMIMRSADPCDSVYRRSEKIRKAALRAADMVSRVLFSTGESLKKTHLSTASPHRGSGQAPAGIHPLHHSNYRSGGQKLRIGQS